RTNIAAPRHPLLVTDDLLPPWASNGQARFSSPLVPRGVCPKRVPAVSRPPEPTEPKLRLHALHVARCGRTRSPLAEVPSRHVPQDLARREVRELPKGCIVVFASRKPERVGRRVESSEFADEHGAGDRRAGQGAPRLETSSNSRRSNSLYRP